TRGGAQPAGAFAVAARELDPAPAPARARPRRLVLARPHARPAARLALVARAGARGLRSGGRTAPVGPECREHRARTPGGRQRRSHLEDVPGGEPRAENAAARGRRPLGLAARRSRLPRPGHGVDEGARAGEALGSPNPRATLHLPGGAA